MKCVDAIAAACKECGASDLPSLCRLMGAPIAKPVKAARTGMKVPETKTTRFSRLPGPFFLYNCDLAEGCETEWCSTLTDCAHKIMPELIKPTQGCATTIEAIEKPTYCSSVLPPQYQKKPKPFLHKVISSEKCPPEVKTRRWDEKNVEAWLKEYPEKMEHFKRTQPDKTPPPPMTVIRLGENPEFKGKLPVKITAKPVAVTAKVIKEPEVLKATIGDFIYYYTLGSEGEAMAPYYNVKREEIPYSEVRKHFKKAEEET